MLPQAREQHWRLSLGSLRRGRNGRVQSLIRIPRLKWLTHGLENTKLATPQWSACIPVRAGQKDLCGSGMDVICCGAIFRTTACCDGSKTLEKSAYFAVRRTTATATTGTGMAGC